MGKGLGFLAVVLGMSWVSAARAAEPVRVLVTAFEKFGGEPENASQKMIEAMLERVKTHPLQRAAVIRARILPVEYGRAEKLLLADVKTFRPTVVVSFGQAPDAGFRLETQAFNLDDSSEPDNAGEVRINQPIVAGGPAKLWHKLPIHAINKRLGELQYPVVLSESAGTYLCNHLFYQLMYNMRPGRPAKNVKVGGFVHVPSLPTDGSMTYDQWGAWGAEAVRAVLDETVFELAP